MNGNYLLYLIIAVYLLFVFLVSRLGNRRQIGRRRLFWTSLFLTPVLGLAFYFNSMELKMHPYTERHYKCEKCGYTFAEEYPYCPFCEKEGIKVALKPVTKFMT